MKLLSFFGVRIDAMKVLGPGRGDAVLHTLKHFLQREECWSNLAPAEAISPEAALDGLKSLGPMRIGAVMVSDAYWEPPRGPAIESIHDRGYYPRYARLAGEAGGWQVPGALWFRQPGKRWVADVRGYRLAGDLEATSFQVVTAYGIPAIQESRPPEPGFFKLGEVWRQKLRQARSSSGERDGEGST